MPKMKSNRAAMKRFRVSATGKIKREHAYANHLFTGKPRSRKRRLRQAGRVDSTDIRRVKRLILR